MRYLAYVVLLMSLASCSYLLPSTTPTVFGLLADRGDTRPFEQPLPINTQPKRLALGSDFAIGIKEDGTVWSWGSGSKGELGMGKKENRAIPQAIPNMTDFVEVAAGSDHVLALRKDGTVWSWGNNEKGALGYKEEGVPWGIPPKIYFDPYQLTPKQIPDLKDVVSIAAGGSFSLALDKQGRVWGWGSESLILKNVFDKTTQKQPKIVYEDKNIAKIMANRGTETAVIFKDGTAIIFPVGGSFMFDDVGERSSLKEYRIYHLPFNDVVDMSMVSGSLHIVLRKDGTVWALGSNHFGALGQCDYKPYKGFVRVKNLGRIKKINGLIAWDEKGYLWHWGVNIYEKWLLKKMFGNRYAGHEPCPIRELKKTDVGFFGDGYLNQVNKVIALNNGDVVFLEQRRSKRELHPINWSWK